MARLTPEQLEQRIHNVLRVQPPRRAPLSLEARVLAEIARRQALPWWQKSFAQWPMAMRLAFVFSALGCLGLALLVTAQVGGWVSAAEASALLQPVTDLVNTVRAIAGLLTEVVGRLFPAVLPMWIYGGLAVLTALYATLVGLGATAYRLLWQAR
jgi:hypothetical protein